MMKTSYQLALLLQQLHAQRKANKKPNPRTTRLTPLQRAKILEKTDGCCHICGCKLEADNFQADHVQNHVGGGASKLDNFLASCNTCNNYRWHYIPEEIQWILKLGVFAKTQIETQTVAGITIAEAFLKKGKAKIKYTKSTMP